MRAAVLMAVVAAIACCGTAHGASTQESLFQDDDLTIHVSPAEADATMAELADIGVDRVRLSAIWKDLSPASAPADPTDPHDYDQRTLAHLDAAVRAAGAHGLAVLLNVRGGVPGWAMQRKPPR